MSRWSGVVGRWPTPAETSLDWIDIAILNGYR